jgi:transcriptional regulator with XRE-family HTH domain
MNPSALARVGALVKAKRREKGIGLRDAAVECGVSPSTLSRLERGTTTSLPDADTLTKVAAWLQTPLATIFAEDSATAIDTPELSTPEIVEVHLRADKRLAPATALALGRAFRLLYDQMAEKPEPNT